MGTLKGGSEEVKFLVRKVDIDLKLKDTVGLSVTIDRVFSKSLSQFLDMQLPQTSSVSRVS